MQTEHHNRTSHATPQKKILLALTAWLCLTASVYAQTSAGATVKVIARVKKDTVILRWGPTTVIGWELGNKYGYVVKRFAVIRNGVMDTIRRPEAVVLTPQPLKPWPEQRWATIAKNDKYVAIGAQAVYGKSFVVTGASSGPVQMYQQTQEQESRWSFALFAADQSKATAEAMALRFIDTGLKKNEKYAYSVSVATPAETKYKIAPGTVYVDPLDLKDLPPPQDLQASFGDGTVSLNWKTLYLQDFYTSYRIERSDDDGKTFKPASDLPFLNTRPSKDVPDRTFYLDSLPHNMTVYHYRVRGVSPFGEVGPPSATIKGIGLNSAKGAVPVLEMTHIYDNGSVYLQWRFPDALRQNLKGFTVSKGSSVKGPFKDITRELVKPGINSYVDPVPDPVNYYIIRAVAQDGTISSSFPAMVQLEDDTPPLSPVGLKGVIDNQGIVTITWSANREPDLSGYRIFKANALHEEFVQITKEIVTELAYRDTVSLETLTREVYYKVIALDNRFNPSDYSAPLVLERPDIIPPAAPKFIKAQSNPGHIALQWLSSPSDDVASYVLLRKETLDSTQRVVAEFKDLTVTSYKDSLITIGNRYEYILRVTDKAGLTAFTTVSLQAIDYGIRAPIREIKHILDREKRALSLGWEYSTTNLQGYAIYRSKNGEPLRRYTFSKSNIFKDKNLQPNTHYTYAVKAVFNDGAESPLSAPITIEY